MHNPLPDLDIQEINPVIVVVAGTIMVAVEVVRDGQPNGPEVDQVDG